MGGVLWAGELPHYAESLVRRKVERTLGFEVFGLLRRRAMQNAHIRFCVSRRSVYARWPLFNLDAQLGRCMAGDVIDWDYSRSRMSAGYRARNS